MPLSRRRVAAGASVLVAVVAGLALSPTAVVERLRGVAFSPLFPLVLVALYAIRPFLAWPITALSVLVGYRYGPAVGFPVAMAGVVATSLVPYVAARRFRADGGVLGRLTDGSERFFERTGGLRGVVLARLAPTPAEAVSAAAGAGRVGLPAFVLGTAVGELPWTAAAVLAGASMQAFSTTGLAAAVDPRLVAAGTLAAFALLLGPAYRYLRDRRATPA